MLKEYKISELKDYKIHGRTSEQTDPLSLFWTASGLEFNFKGKELKLRYHAEFDIYVPWMDIIIGGVRYQKRTLEKGTHEISLWQGMEQEAFGQPVPVRNFKIIRDTPAMPADAGLVFQIEAIIADGEFTELDHNKLKLEFIGDSITSGEGCMGPVSEQDWNSSCFDVIDNYAYMTANGLDADYNVVSQSGWGFAWSFYGNPAEQIPKYYEDVCGLVPRGRLSELGAKDKWNFGRFIPDVIIVNLGTNDVGAYSSMGQEIAKASGLKEIHTTDENGRIPEKDTEKLKQAAGDFLTMIRKNNPSSIIIWSYGMLNQDSEIISSQMYEILETAVKQYAKETADSNVHFLKLPLTMDGEFGSRSHPGHLSHKKTADCLIEFIKSNHKQ